MHQELADNALALTA